MPTVRSKRKDGSGSMSEEIHYMPDHKFRYFILGFALGGLLMNLLMVIFR